MAHPFRVFAKWWETTNLNRLSSRGIHANSFARTQTLVGQMGWVFERPLLTAIEISWRWCFGLPFVIVIFLRRSRSSSPCRRSPRARHARSAEPLGGRGATRQQLGALSAASCIGSALASAAGRAGLGGCLRSGPQRSSEAARSGASFSSAGDDRVASRSSRLLRPLLPAMVSCNALGRVTHIGGGAEPDLVGFAAWAIFLSLSFFTHGRSPVGRSRLRRS